MNRLLLFILFYCFGFIYGQNIKHLKRDSTYKITSDSLYLISKGQLNSIYSKHEQRLRIFQSLATKNNQKATELIILYSKEIKILKHRDSLLLNEIEHLQTLNDSLITTQSELLYRTRKTINLLTNKVDSLYEATISYQNKAIRKEKLKIILVGVAIVATNTLNLILNK
jgi:uncharacterized protein with NRDE domain